MIIPKKLHITEKITEELDFTPDLFGGMSVELYAGKPAIIQGIKAILEYDENLLRVSSGTEEVRITGTELILKQMTAGGILVEGKISSAEFSGKAAGK